MLALSFVFMPFSVTTDVQNVNISQIGNTSNYSIQCSYVEGSDALGCAYTFSADGVESVTGNISRNIIEGVIVELPDVSCFNEVLVYDWESDGTIGTLPVPVDNSSTISMCFSIDTFNVASTATNTASGELGLSIGIPL